jgi:hypothetical protein
MYECFLTAVVPDEDAVRARSVLHLGTGRADEHTLTRVLFVNSPAPPAQGKGSGLPSIKALMKDRANGKKWQELDAALKTQSHTLSARFVVDENALRSGNE